MPRPAPPLLAAIAWGLGALVGACASPPPVDLPAAVAPPLAASVAAEVGRLLSPDPAASRVAQARLLAGDEAVRDAVAAHARSIPGERDPRWLHVLDALGLWQAPGPEDRLSLEVWRVGSDDPATSLRGQAGLRDLAASHPALLAERLAVAGPGRDAVALALGAAGARSAAPALIRLFRESRLPRERRAAAEALARLAGEDLRPLWDGTPEERARDVARLEAWWARAQGGGHGSP